MSNCIYQIINHITNDCYVGKTVSSPEIRYKRHLSNAARGDKTYLYSAMRKYGVENFTVNLLEETSEELLSSLEIHYINLLKPSYNMAKGGEGGSTTHLRMWINNGTQNKYILKEDTIPTGYVKGRLCKFNDPEFQQSMSKRAHNKMTPQDYKNRGHAISKGKLGKTHVGVPHTQETKNKLRNYRLNDPILTCPNCGKEGKGGLMYRWHFDKCKNI